MDKNTIIGFVLIAIVVFGFSWYSQPSEEEQAAFIEAARQDSINRAEAQAAEMAQAAEKARKLAQEANDSSALFFEARNAPAQDVKLSNGLIDLTLSTRGATVKSARLANFNDQEGKPVRLIRNGKNGMTFCFAGKQDNLETGDFTFKTVAKTGKSVTMRLGDEQCGLDISYTLNDDSYLVNVDIQAHNMGKVLLPNSGIATNWHYVAAQQEKGFDFEDRYTALTFKKKGGGVDNLSASGENDETTEDDIDWVAFKNQFFSYVLISQDGFNSGAELSSKTCRKGSGDLKEYHAQLSSSFDVSGRKATKMQMYIGPNDFHLLKAHNSMTFQKDDADLEKLVDLGWPLFRWINRWIILPLFDFLTGFGLNMGIVLLLLTIIVKALVYPTTKKSFLSSARMRVLKPQVDALSAKYPRQEDAMKKQAEMMQLYKEYGVSPMGGCLPMLIQAPIWIALFNFVPNAIELRGQSFLWAKDLSSYDELISWDTDLWLIGDHLSIFCILFSLTNIVNTLISMRQQQNQMSSEQASQMKMMQYMMYIMPLMFFFMFNNYSSGLCYYYFLSGLTSILIMWYLRKTTDDDKLLAKLEAYREAHKNDTRKPSGMAARLAALQEQMEQQKKK